MATPHIKAELGDFGKTVLMPGDPLRSQFIAENFLEDAKLVNNVRGVQGYTGTYNGTKVSVMASGMGIPSIGIYSYELFNFFGVENIIRVGTTGSINNDVNVRDIVLAMGASYNGNYVRQFQIPGTYSAIADYTILENAVNTAKELGLTYHVGNVLSSDTFYDDQADANDYWQKMGVLAIEMETAGLYMNAARAGKRALGLFTVSDHILKGEATSADERQKTFTSMMELALKTAVKLDTL